MECIALSFAACGKIGALWGFDHVKAELFIFFY